MQIAISGHRGFIGGPLSEELIHEGHQLSPIVRRLPRSGEIGLDLEGRRLDTSQLPGGDLSSIDAIVHLGGEPLTPRRWNARKRELIRSSRISSTDLISRAIATSESPPRSLIVMSAIGYYGSTGDAVVTERNSSGEGFLAELCRAWEAAASPARAVGTRVIHARTGIVLGKSGGLLKSLTPIFALGLGGNLGNGHQWMSPIALVDEVRALARLTTDLSLEGAYNLTSPVPVTNALFTREFARSLHRPAFLPVPEFALTLALGHRTATEMALTSQRVIPERLLAAGFTFSQPLVADALGH